MMTEPAVRIARLPMDSARRLRAHEVLTPAEAERFRRNPDEGFLLGRLLLHELADELMDDLVDQPPGAPVAITAVCAQCGEEHGRPVAAGLWLSVAHAGDVVVVAAAVAPVGVDVERADARIPAEYGGNVRSWTRLEAVLKADGRGIVVHQRDVVFQSTTAPAKAALAAQATPAAPAVSAVTATAAGVRYSVREVDFDAEYVISLAWAETGPRAIHQTGRQAETR
jgi:4'-phosphopantetheinyl transferase